MSITALAHSYRIERYLGEGGMATVSLRDDGLRSYALPHGSPFRRCLGVVNISHWIYYLMV